MLFFSLSFLLTARNGSVFFLGPCQVLVVQSFAFSFCLSKVGSLTDWLVAEAFCTIRENPMLRILNSFSSCSDVDVLLHADSVVQHYVVFFPPDGWQWLSVFFVAVPSWKYRWVASVLSSLSGLWKLLFRLVVHLLSFRRFVLGSTTAVLLSNVSGDLRWRGSCSARTPLDSAKISHFFPQLQQIKPISQYVLHSRHCCLEEFSQKSKISVLFMSAIKSCDSLLNLLIFCVWLKSWMNDSLCWEFSNFSINLLTLFSRVAIRCSTTKRGTPEIL